MQRILRVISAIFHWLTEDNWIANYAQTNRPDVTAIKERNAALAESTQQNTQPNPEEKL